MENTTIKSEKSAKSDQDPIIDDERLFKKPNDKNDGPKIIRRIWCINTITYTDADTKKSPTMRGKFDSDRIEI